MHQKAKKSYFIAVEGLDGSGKSTIAAKVVEVLNEQFPTCVKLSYEPHNDCVGGQWIRSVLEKRITQFSHEALALAFAANRKDHNDRLIHPWLAQEGKMLITDRYYLSSLVYQSGAHLSMPEVMQLNRFARQPDLIIFFNVSDATCYARMKQRNQQKELFEEKLAETRQKFKKAIGYLRRTKKIKIVEIDANGAIEEVFEQMMNVIKTNCTDWF